MPPVRSLIRLALLLAVLGFTALIASPAESAGGSGNTFIVDTNAASNLSACADATLMDCSLSGAITKANLGQGNSIHFALPGCPGTPSACVISPGLALPTITKMTTIIDGTTQNGYTDAPIVVIDGTGAGNVDGLTITADNAVVWGLWIRDFELSGINDYLGAHINATFSYNHIEANGSNGIAVAVGTTSGSELDMDSNTIINNGDTGVYAAYATMHKAVIQNNTITGNNGRGLDITVSDDLTLTNNNISGSLAGSGIYATATNTTSVTFNNNQVNNNSEEGAQFAVSGTLSASGNTITGNTYTGLDSSVTTATTMMSFTGNTISNNGSGNGDKGANLAVSGTLTVDNNNMLGNSGDAIDASYVNANNINITDNEIGGSGQNGLNLAVSNSLVVSGNYVHNNSINGIQSVVTTTSTVTVDHNNFVANGGAGMNVAGTTMSAHFNRFFNNVSDGIQRFTGGTIDAINNWWGCNEGPGTTDCDSAGGATTNPWLVLSLDAPASAATGSSSPITADVNHDSDGADVSGSGHLNDGTEVLFGTDVGNIDGSPTDAGSLNNGAVSDVFNAPNNPATAHIFVTLDNETVTLNVSITSTATPTPTPSPTPTGSASPSPSATQSPTATPFGSHAQGDTNCSGTIDGADGLPPLFFAAGFQGVSVQGGCPHVGTGSPLFGDVNCDGAVDGRDVIAILQHFLGLAIDPTPQPGCTPIGSALP